MISILLTWGSLVLLALTLVGGSYVIYMLLAYFGKEDEN